MAWGHVVCDIALRKSADIGGNIFFLTDDTPIMNTFQFQKLFLEACGMKLSETKLPYWLAYGIIFVGEKAAQFLSPVSKIDLPVPLCSLIYINNNLTFSSKKARDALGYKPLYSFDESVTRSLKYYRDMKNSSSQADGTPV